MCPSIHYTTLIRQYTCMVLLYNLAQGFIYSKSVEHMVWRMFEVHTFPPHILCLCGSHMIFLREHIHLAHGVRFTYAEKQNICQTDVSGFSVLRYYPLMGSGLLAGTDVNQLLDVRGCTVEVCMGERLGGVPLGRHVDLCWRFMATGSVATSVSKLDRSPCPLHHLINDPPPLHPSISLFVNSSSVCVLFIYYCLTTICGQAWLPKISSFTWLFAFFNNLGVSQMTKVERSL